MKTFTISLDTLLQKAQQVDALKNLSRGQIRGLAVVGSSAAAFFQDPRPSLTANILMLSLQWLMDRDLEDAGFDDAKRAELYHAMDDLIAAELTEQGALPEQTPPSFNPKKHSSLES